MGHRQEHGYKLPRHLLNSDITIAAINETRTAGPPNAGSNANFDSNMVIILAALLCALICALGLNSIVRFALRWSRRLSLETAGGVASTGITKEALRRVPVVVYKPGINGPATTTDCPICLGEFSEGEKVRILPRCNHGFHVKCVDTWFESHSSCPNCRQLLFGHPISITASATTAT